jgi:hypothetical protein
MTALAGAVLAFGAAAPAAFATLPPPEPGRTGDTAPVVIHTVIVGGMPGGKIILIAAGPCTRNAAAHDGARRLKRAAALRYGLQVPARPAGRVMPSRLPSPNVSRAAARPAKD